MFVYVFVQLELSVAILRMRKQMAGLKCSKIRKEKLNLFSLLKYGQKLLDSISSKSSIFICLLYVTQSCEVLVIIYSTYLPFCHSNYLRLRNTDKISTLHSKQLWTVLWDFFVLSNHYRPSFYRKEPILHAFYRRVCSM